MCTFGQRVGRATCPKEECFVRPPRVRLRVVPTTLIKEVRVMTAVIMVKGDFVVE